MITLTPAEEAILRPEYDKYLADQLRYRMHNGDDMSFDDWWRAQADNAKDSSNG